MGGLTEGSPETPRTSQHYRIEGIKGVPDLGTKEDGNRVFSVYNAMLKIMIRVPFLDGEYDVRYYHEDNASRRLCKQSEKW